MRRITPENLIAVNRMDKFLAQLIDALEEKDKDFGPKIKAIKKRTRGKRIEITREARKKLVAIAAQEIGEALSKAITVVYLNGKATISEETLEQAKSL
jgi:hypothetical protein